MGSATQFLKQEAGTDIFRKATGYSLKSETMRDREMVNRFCAFHVLGVDSYRGDMDEFLAQALELMNGVGQGYFQKLSTLLRTSMKNNLTVFDRHAFRKYVDGQGTRSVFNASLWDVMSTLMSQLPENVVEARRTEIKAGFDHLMTRQEFLDSITLGTSQINRVRDRSRMVSEMPGDFGNV